MSATQQWKIRRGPSLNIHRSLGLCAAAHLLHQDKDNSWIALKKKVGEGLFEIGRGGELTCRLALLLAKDSYVRRSDPRYSFEVRTSGAMS